MNAYGGHGHALFSTIKKQDRQDRKRQDRQDKGEILSILSFTILSILLSITFSYLKDDDTLITLDGFSFQADIWIF